MVMNDLEKLLQMGHYTAPRSLIKMAFQVEGIKESVRRWLITKKPKINSVSTKLFKASF